MDAIRKAIEALAELSNTEWLQVRDAEDRRRADQDTIRSLAKKLRELRAHRDISGAVAKGGSAS